MAKVRDVDGLVVGPSVRGGKSFGTVGRKKPLPEQDLTQKVKGNVTASPKAAGPQSKKKKASGAQEARSGAGMEKKQGRVKKVKVV